MKRTDREICIDAIRDARRILSEFSDPGSAHDAGVAIYELMNALDNQTFDAALDRIDGRKYFGIVTVERYDPPNDEDTGNSR